VKNHHFLGIDPLEGNRPSTSITLEGGTNPPSWPDRTQSLEPGTNPSSTTVGQVHGAIPWNARVGWVNRARPALKRGVRPPFDRNEANFRPESRTISSTERTQNSKSRMKPIPGAERSQFLNPERTQTSGAERSHSGAVESRFLGRSEAVPPIEGLTRSLTYIRCPGRPAPGSASSCPPSKDGQLVGSQLRSVPLISPSLSRTRGLLTREPESSPLIAQRHL
jgi:hypothetical protein